MADLLDIVDLESMLTVLAVPDGKVGQLASYITMASRNIDDLCGPVVQRTVTGEEHHGGDYCIVLDFRPVVSVTSVTEQGATIAGTGYHLDAKSGILERRQVGTYTAYPWYVGRWNVAVTYVAGRYATTDVVDELFRQAAMMTVAYVWQCEQGGGGTATYGAYEGETVQAPGTSFVLPKSAFMLLKSSIQPVAGIA